MKFKTKMQVNKILIWMPLAEWLLPFETHNLIQSLEVPEWFVVNTMFVAWSTVAKARNIITRTAIDNDYDYLLFLDDDNPPEQLDFLCRMIEADKDIICWLIRTRWEPYRLCIRDKIINEWGCPEYVNYTNIERVDGWLEPIRIHACWTWCVLIKTSLLKQLMEYYQWSLFETKMTSYLKTTDWKYVEYIVQNHKALQNVDVSDWVLRSYSAVLSEDILFCDRATFHWYKVRCLPYVTCWHITKQIVWVWWETFIS